MTAQLSRTVYRVGNPENDDHHFTDQKDHADVAKNNGYEVAEYALAGMDSEPVAYIFKHPSGKLFWALTDESNKGRKDVMPVYAAPPAPVAVPDESRVITHHFDTIALETAREIMCDVNRRADFLGGDIQLLSRIQCRIDEACRAAMLNAGHVTAVTVPDGWKLVPVEPTAEMYDAGDMQLATKQVWDAMLAVAPAAPEQE